MQNIFSVTRINQTDNYAINSAQNRQQIKPPVLIQNHGDSEQEDMAKGKHTHELVSFKSLPGQNVFVQLVLPGFLRTFLRRGFLLVFLFLAITFLGANKTLFAFASVRARCVVAILCLLVTRLILTFVYV
jgi:hypothetical protein